MGLIYKATNIANNKVYVGQTKCSVEKRWDEHIREAKRNCDNSKINNAIRKYGADNFVVTAIEEVPDSMLNEREIFWISKLDARKCGYNSTLGGDGSLQVDYDTIKMLWDAGMSVQDIISSTGHCKTTVLSALHPYKNYSNRESVMRGKTNQMRRVCQYDMDGGYIRTFIFTSEAAHAHNVDRTLITAVCNGKRRSGAGYQWRYEGDVPPNDYIFEQKKKQPVNMYDISGNLMASYSSLAEAERNTGIGFSGISACCNNRRKTAGGYAWSYAG